MFHSSIPILVLDNVRKTVNFALVTVADGKLSLGVLSNNRNNESLCDTRVSHDIMSSNVCTEQ